MPETSNKAKIAVKISEEIFTVFGWGSRPLRDANWDCVTKRHNKTTHPADVVFTYDDPFLRARPYLLTDLKSYARTTINWTSVKQALESLAMSLDCATRSASFRNLYVAENDNFLVTAMLFIYNHDGLYLAKQMFSHPQLHEALKLMEHEEKEEKAIPSKIDADVDMSNVAQAFERVRDERKDPDEQMQITQRPSGELEVKYGYTHLDFSQATLRQRTSKEITFLIQKNGKVLDFSYNNNPKAAEIYSEVKTILKGAEPCAITEQVSLNGIEESGKRIAFFLDLMNGVEGFRLRTVINVKAERMANIPSEGEDGKAHSKEEVEEMVKKMALIGGSVWTSPEFQAMVKSGFFVYNARWFGTELDGDNRTMEFDAGFSTGECLDFSTRVLGYYKRSEDGSLEKKISPLPNSERELLRSRVQKSAFESVEKIQPPKAAVVVPVTAPQAPAG